MHEESFRQRLTAARLRGLPLRVTRLREVAMSPAEIAQLRPGELEVEELGEMRHDFMFVIFQTILLLYHHKPSVFDQSTNQGVLNDNLTRTL